ncbi:hypothetical protein [cf. Phormidesmis sp. LEGE 11477]|uniref:hypothetical protein n=1 Tax=cf. Phormidesmis sp. LEGE 11477 TaxID=1828680 RepID=UPI00187FAE5C|nr:hypothetical protein [cf. Phormidesmis sp. LEGE 11477]MBE9062400.1 hypothetical protein [cf. Phormidesmis sp. LEGE 11477]
MTILRQAAALALPLCIFGCSATGADDVNANSPAEPVPEPVLSQPPTSSPTSTSLNSVPPDGLDSLSESDFRYFQSMGPLEYAIRLGGVPTVPTWRIRLRLYPVQQDGDLLYQVKVDHYNLSPALYSDLVSSYGEENVDPILDNNTSHQHIDLEFLPVMNVAADWLSESTQMSTSAVAESPTCGLGTSCSVLYNPEVQEWNGESTVSLEMAPWASDSDPLPTMVRTLAEQASWLQNDFWTMPPEIPEGISSERPWVEVLVTNYPGNGGGYMAHWIERIADDSVQATVHRLFYDPEAISGFVSKGYICGRGAEAGQVRALCP